MEYKGHAAKLTFDTEKIYFMAETTLRSSYSPDYNVMTALSLVVMADTYDELKKAFEFEIDRLERK